MIKVMLKLFRDLHGTILEHYQEGGMMINSSHCSGMLRDKLKPVI
jgi:hypothetical protein